MTTNPVRYFDPAVNRFMKWAAVRLCGRSVEPDLLPIIPPGAPISADAGPNITADKLGKIPGLRLPDGWIGFKGWTGVTASRETLVAWHDTMAREQYGIGLQTRHINAFDVDTKRLDFAQAMLGWMQECRIGFSDDKPDAFAVARVGRPPSFLVPFPTDRERKKDRKVFVHQATGEAAQIEWLATGQQFVVEGIHPKTLEPYTWHKITPLTTVADMMQEHADQVARWTT